MLRACLKDRTKDSTAALKRPEFIRAFFIIQQAMGDPGGFLCELKIHSVSLNNL